MRLKNFRLKLKGIRIRRFFSRKKARNSEKGKTDCSWMMHVSHGYHVVEMETGFKEFDSVVVQREQVEESEFWFFGVFDDGISKEVTKYMQSHFFDHMPKKSRIKQSKQAMKRAHMNARAKLGDGDESEAGSATAMVIDGEKLVVANMGDFKTVICKDGEAYQICRKKQQQPATRHWSLKLIPGMSFLHSPKVHKIADKPITSSGTKIFSNDIIWQVMRHQEAVNLIRHIENPQEAAECLATEALTRLSKSNISCLIIRFD
ncbi:hypothetical protein RD792_009627 [Penstemon davidsonii]|uniref:PPM-type phosphatase domain-containing protein n=1 Tax=Penstemon davidsonii TaxID=160366 RepID=A0ABR0CZK7_9LAMI|nr:hypothetical protein RD792_009627 [Penstemon davidsonii]